VTSSKPSDRPTLKHGVCSWPPCPECGSGDHTEEPTYELLLDDDCEERGIDAPDESVYCEVCGELVFGVVEFDEDR
jgi:hypothetical protein